MGTFFFASSMKFVMVCRVYNDLPGIFSCVYLYFLWYRFLLYSAWLVAQRMVSDVLVFVIFFLFCVGRCITVWICSYSCCVVVFVLCVFPVSRGGKFAPDDDCYKVETCSVLSMKKYLLTYTKDSCVVCIFLQNTVTVTRHNVA